MAGVHFMRQRKPVDMKAFSVLHNLFMFWLSLYMVIETTRQVGRDACLPMPAGPLLPACCRMHACMQMAYGCRMQASANMGWLWEGGGWLWGNVVEAPGRPFSPSGRALARVLWIHYLSKVQHLLSCTKGSLHVLKRQHGACLAVLTSYGVSACAGL